SEDECSFEVRNLVFIHSVDNEFDLAELSLGLGIENSEYDPEHFPGLVYRNPKIDGVFIIFRTGKIMLMGIKDEDEAIESYRELHSILSDLGIEIPSLN
ncbi:MAG: transcription factor, partial [Halobacteriaceae archaeon]